MRSKLAKVFGCSGAALALLVGATACGGGAESAGEGSGGGEPVLATVEVLAESVTVRRAGDTVFNAAESGSEMGQGDELRTDASGFAEVVFFDGSWQRVDNESTLTLTELVDIEGGRVVRTGIDRGRAWQRVEALTSDEESVELDTPVAVAAVRGTAYAVECTGEPVSCTYSVVEGNVELTVSSGESVDLTAGQQLTASRDLPIGAPQTVGVEQLEQNEWIARNLARDRTDPPTAPPGDEDGLGSAGVDEEFAAAANAVCATADQDSRAVEDAGATGDDLAVQQAEILDGALDELETLEAPAEADEQYQQMIADYRQRTTLVRQAVGVTGDERSALVTELLGVTASGAAHARELGLEQCIVRSR